MHNTKQQHIFSLPLPVHQQYQQQLQDNRKNDGLLHNNNTNIGFDASFK